MRYLLLILFSFSACAQDCAVGDDTTHTVNLLCTSDYKALAGKPLTSKYSNVSSLKLVYVIKSQELYFINSSKYQFHYEFCKKILGDSIDLENFNEQNYRVHPRRKYLLVNLNFYEDQKKYLVELYPGEESKPEWIYAMLKILRQQTPQEMNLAVLDNNPILAKPNVLPDEFKRVTSDDIYAKQTYQCLKSGVAYGYLRKVSAKDISSAKLNPHDIVMLDNLPLHLPWVQAVITDVFQTPLSHINVLCSNRGIPNCSWKDVYKNKNLDKYLNTLVKIHVREDRVIIAATTLSAAEIFWKQQEKGTKIKLQTDVSVNKLVKLEKAKKLSISSIGAKAYNFSQLTHVRTSAGKSIQTPENPFAIPFYFYAQHIHEFCIQELIDSATALPKNADPVALKARLKRIRNAIEKAPIDSQLLSDVRAMMIKDKRFPHYRFRSSTNAEDIEGFNGAGLYESHTGSLTDTSKRIEDAIREVWSSLWNYNAFMEREYFNINHSEIAMGILVHRSFGDDYANGVAITKHLYRSGYPAYTINVQLGETSVVSPVDSITAAQFILVFKGFENEESYSLDYITHSSLAKEKEILSEAQLKQLVVALRAIKKHFYAKEKSDEYFYNYGLDVEFKVDALSKNVYIKQVRPYR